MPVLLLDAVLPVLAKRDLPAGSMLIVRSGPPGTPERHIHWEQGSAASH